MTVETVRIADATHDQHERASDTVNIDGNKLHCSHFATTLMAILHFDPVDVPQGATINTGTYITVVPGDTAEDDADFVMQAEDVDDSATPDGTNGDISGRTLTSESVSWVNDALGTSAVNSPDLATVIKAIITDRGGWATGQALSIVWTSNANSKALWVSPRNVNESDAPLLTVDYTVASTFRPKVMVF